VQTVEVNKLATFGLRRTRLRARSRRPDGLSNGRTHRSAGMSRHVPVLDLDAAASETQIEARRAGWSAAGLQLGQLTWRDRARGWLCQLVSRDRAMHPDSVGFRVTPARKSLPPVDALFGRPSAVK
jgi:hypothetical protein